MMLPMKTLIIHPTDSTTWFLDIVYKGIPNKTVVTGDLSEKELVKAIRSHDRIMMMGHGSPNGLFAVGQFPGRHGYVIDRRFAPLLRQKQDNVYIWCHASDFVETHGLTGFSSGMFISEVYEANFCGVQADQEQVDESNFLFVEEMGKHLASGSTTDAACAVLSGSYAQLANQNPVAAYNHARLRSFVEANQGARQ